MKLKLSDHFLVFGVLDVQQCTPKLIKVLCTMGILVDLVVVVC